MDVWHPKDGAVYWEGPVNVSLGVTLAGEKNVLVHTILSCVVEMAFSTARFVLVFAR